MLVEAQLCNAYAHVLAAVLLPQNRIYGGKAKRQPQLEFRYYSAEVCFQNSSVSVLQKYSIVPRFKFESWGVAVVVFHACEECVGAEGRTPPRLCGHLSPWCCRAPALPAEGASSLEQSDGFNLHRWSSRGKTVTPIALCDLALCHILSPTWGYGCA